MFLFRPIFNELRAENWFLPASDHSKGRRPTQIDGGFSGSDEGHVWMIFIKFQLLTIFFHFGLHFLDYYMDIRQNAWNTEKEEQQNLSRGVKTEFRVAECWGKYF